MLRISNRQMQVFAGEARRSFEDRMVAHMRVRSGIRDTLAPDEIRSRVHGLVDLAERYGIRFENDVRRFLEIVFDRSSEILQHPKITALLEAKDLSPGAKVAFVADVVHGEGLR